MNKKIIIVVVLFLLLAGASFFFFFREGGEEALLEDIDYGEVLNIYNWEDYLSEDVVSDFEELYGIKVNVDYFEDSDDVLVMLQSDPERYDIVIVDDDYVEYFSRLRFLDRLNHERIPNIANINKDIISGSFDEDMNYCAPYVPGYTGIAVNANYIEDYDGDRSIFWNENYKGKITMPISAAEILVNSIFHLGYSPDDMNDEKFKEAEAKTLELKEMDIMFGDPIQQREWLAGEDALIGYTYSTEVVFIQEENEDIDFFAPKDGALLWSDAMCIPKDAKNKEAAHLFINYLLDIENMAKNSEDIYAMMSGKNIEEYMDIEIVEDLKGLSFPEDESIMKNSLYISYYLMDNVQEILSNISRELNIRE